MTARNSARLSSAPVSKWRAMGGARGGGVYVDGVAMRVLTWNLKHGRAVPSAGRDLFEEFAAALK